MITAVLRATICGMVVLLCSPVSNAQITLYQPDASELRLEKPATRVITLAPHLAELMFTAGSGEQLLATVEYSDFPEPVKHLPRIGDAFRFDLERILSLKPDLIIAWDSGNPGAALERLEQLGLKVWRTEVRKTIELAGLLRQIGLATGNPEPAEAAAEQFLQRLSALTTANENKTALRYFYQVAQHPLYTVNGDHLISQGLALCGGINVFADLTVLAPQISPEAVLIADPEVLIGPRIDGQEDSLEHWKNWPNMTAVSKKQLVRLPADETNRATPRILDSMELACQQFDDIRNQH